MFCISIFQESRRFALVDMLNASRQCDLLELRLDRFAKDPEVGEMLNARPKPVICCCRRPQDGGEWDSTEEERLALLRQCVVSGADYVELELDVAGQIRRYGSTKRVISYTNLRETPENIAEIYAEAQTKQPDVVKLVTRAQTPEEAWPLVQILARPALPTVVVGLGPSSAMLTLLARRTSAPWTYAALERGMEAYPGQLSINDLKTIYRYQDIGKATRFVGVIGSGEHSAWRRPCSTPPWSRPACRRAACRWKWASRRRSARCWKRSRSAACWSTRRTRRNCATSSPSIRVRPTGSGPWT